MYRPAFGHALATLAIGAGIVEPAAAQAGDVSDNLNEGAGESAATPINATYDVTGLVDNASLGAGRARRLPASTAFAPSLVATDDTCMGSRSFGVQAMGFGVSFATTWGDRQCRRVKNARQLYALGYPGAAVQLLCQDDEVRAAMARAGTPCETLHFIRDTEPAPAEPPPLISFDDVLFDFDRSTIRADAVPILQPLLDMMLADPGMRIEIEGHTDWVGSDAYNEGLSERRARAVVDWLAARGVSRERLSADGRGESEPIATNATAAGRQMNRRVEVRRMDTPSSGGG